MHGAVTQVILDGRPLHGVANLTFEVSPKSVAKVYLELYADVSIEGNVEVERMPADERGSHELGRMEARPAFMQNLNKALGALEEDLSDGKSKE